MDDDDDKIEQAIAGRASQDGAFAVAYALLRIARALNVQPLTVDELGEPKEIWWTHGQYDVVSVVEAPDDASAITLAMSVGKLGFIRTQTLRAYSAAELAPIMDKVV